MYIKTLFFVSLFLSAPLTWATSNRTIYKTVLPNGEVLYSSAPRPGSEEMKINLPSKVNHPTEPSSNAPLEAPQGIPVQYQIQFITPKNEQLFGVAEPDIPISLQITPALHDTDGVQLFIDNKAYGILQSDLEYTLSNLDRGTHTLQAKIFPNKQSGTPKGETGVIAIHIFKPSILTRPGN